MLHGHCLYMAVMPLLLVLVALLVVPVVSGAGLPILQSFLLPDRANVLSLGPPPTSANGSQLLYWMHLAQLHVVNVSSGAELPFSPLDLTQAVLGSGLKTPLDCRLMQTSADGLLHAFDNANGAILTFAPPNATQPHCSLLSAFPGLKSNGVQRFNVEPSGRFAFINNALTLEADMYDLQTPQSSRPPQPVLSVPTGLFPSGLAFADPSWSTSLPNQTHFRLIATHGLSNSSNSFSLLDWTYDWNSGRLRLVQNLSLPSFPAPAYITGLVWLTPTLMAFTASMISWLCILDAVTLLRSCQSKVAMDWSQLSQDWQGHAVGLDPTGMALTVYASLTPEPALPSSSSSTGDFHPPAAAQPDWVLWLPWMLAGAALLLLCNLALCTRQLLVSRRDTVTPEGHGEVLVEDEWEDEPGRGSSPTAKDEPLLPQGEPDSTGCQPVVFLSQGEV